MRYKWKMCPFNSYLILISFESKRSKHECFDVFMKKNINIKMHISRHGIVMKEHRQYQVKDDIDIFRFLSLTTLTSEKNKLCRIIRKMTKMHSY